MWVGYFKLVSAQMLGMFTNDQTDSSSLTDVAPFNHSAQIAHTASFRAAR